MKAFLKGLAAVAVLVIAVNTANAGFVAGFNGNSQLGPTALGAGTDDSSDGIVSFAVYATEDSDWTDDFTPFFDADVTSGSTFSSGVDVDTDFVYFYQVTNNNPGTVDNFLSLLRVPEASPGVFTSWGFVHRHVFLDTAAELFAPVGPLGNEALGTEPLPPDSPGDHTPGDSASPPTGFFDTELPPLGEDVGGLVPDAQDPTGAQVVIDNGSRYLQFTLNFVGTGSFTSILFATSNKGPIYLTGELQDGLPESQGDIAVPTPEPATLALLLGGAPLGLVALRRRRKTA
jgi:hypothetical protein